MRSCTQCPFPRGAGQCGSCCVPSALPGTSLYCTTGRQASIHALQGSTECRHLCQLLIFVCSPVILCESVTPDGVAKRSPCTNAWKFFVARMVGSYKVCCRDDVLPNCLAYCKPNCTSSTSLVKAHAIPARESTQYFKAKCVESTHFLT